MRTAWIAGRGKRIPPESSGSQGPNRNGSQTKEELVRLGVPASATGARNVVGRAEHGDQELKGDSHIHDP